MPNVHIQVMRAEDIVAMAKDAARYRWLRANATWADQRDGEVKWVFYLPMAIPTEPMTDLDAAVDGLMEEQE